MARMCNHDCRGASIVPRRSPCEHPDARMLDDRFATARCNRMLDDSIDVSSRSDSGLLPDDRPATGKLSSVCVGSKLDERRSLARVRATRYEAQMKRTL